MERPLNDSRLLAVFQLVNDWLKYAELKNGALLALNGGAIIGIHQLWDWHKWTSELVIGWLWLATTGLAAAILVGLASFYSRTKTYAFDMPTGLPSPTTSAIYFGHLALMARSDILTRLVPNFDTAKSDHYLEDMADQIIINSRIASRKFSLFNLSLHLTLMGILTPFGWLLYYWKFCDEKL